jgi:hypothetical protein
VKVTLEMLTAEISASQKNKTPMLEHRGLQSLFLCQKNKEPKSCLPYIYHSKALQALVLAKFQISVLA